MPTKEAISVADILNSDTYIIPIYQRNYEWKKEQIFKLIEDVNSIEPGKKYYLGTLVTFNRGGGVYELIDGQQRHTTLNLIKAVLDQNNRDFNLKFQARAECIEFFKNISTMNVAFDQLPRNNKSKNLLQGLEIIEEVITELGIKKDTFYKKLSDNTFIFRTELPPETELNHYFEIMNNRGEQLEKHEILKARLMSAFNEDDRKSNLFSDIWNACSDMGDYVWNNFEKELSLKIFEEQDDFSFDKLITDGILPQEKEKNLGEINEGKKMNLLHIISKHPLPNHFTQNEQEKADRFRSVIDFPTLLLYVYYLMSKEKTNRDFDDKKLLDVFKNYQTIDSEIFITELLKTRIYFDRFIIKNDLSHYESKWGIRTFKIQCKEGDKEIKTEETSFGGKDLEDKIEMLQAMFYYSAISENKKDWLLLTLEQKPQTDIALYHVLLNVFREKINVLQIENLKYGNVTTKVFYYFEYMLWEIYFDFLRGKNEILTDKQLVISSVLDKIDKNSWNQYRFRQLNSKEHLLAQSKAKEEELHCLHSFGNLCLISTSQNSSGNDQHPSYKKQYLKDNSSLKRLLMYRGFSGEKEDHWSTEEIQTHQAEMTSLLEFYKGK